MGDEAIKLNPKNAKAYYGRGVMYERLGHSTIAITGDIYSHVVPGLQKAAAHSFEDAMGEVVETAS